MIGAALIARWSLDGVLGSDLVFLFLLSALLPLAVLVQPGPFLVSAALGFVGTWLVFVLPDMRLSPAGNVPGPWLGVVGMVLGATVLTAWLSHRMRGLRERDQRVLLEDEHRLRLAHASRAIASSEERYRTLFESIDEGFCILQVIFDGEDRPIDYRYLEVNPAFEKQTGIRDAVGKTIRELVPNIEPFWFDTYGKVALTGEAVRFSDHAESMGRWFEVGACRVGEPEQRRVAVLFTDITRRKQAEDALARELKDHKRVQEISCRLIPTDDIQTLYKELVDAAVEISQADCGTMQALDHEAGELRLLEAKGLPKAALERSARVSLDANTSCARCGREGQRVIVDYATDEQMAGTPEALAHLELGVRAAQSTPLITRSGRLAGILTTHWKEPHEPPERSLYLLDILARQAADLIERAQTDEALREADRRKDEFLATLGHELRNPLAAIRMAMEVLGNAREDPVQVGEMATIIERQTGQLVRLIDDLLDVSRISRGRVRLDRKRVDLVEIVGQVLADAMPMLAAKGLLPSAVLPDRPILVFADPVRLAQVVNNLLFNAGKFTPRGGEVHVTIEREGGEAVVRVSDTGIGLPADQLSRIFEMFTQVGDFPTRRSDGLGIGLAIARTVIELHGGRIEARSEGPGRGSEFLVRLGTCDSEAAEVDVERVSSDGERPVENGLRIVAADDNLDALLTVAMLLRMKGHEVETAVDGAEAFDKVREQRPDIALLDIGMPDKDGYAVARSIRREPWGKDMLLVAMTGWGQERDKQRALAAGFDLHLTKPVDLDALERLFASHRAGVAKQT